jgi:hypothetical protein
MNKRRFIDNFISTFCATWCANHWDQYCQEDRHLELQHPPVEDANLLAKTAWEEYRTYVLRISEKE